MEFVLNSKIIESEKKDKIKNAVILLHGYGGDGADISSIAYTWRRFIDDTIFLCPDGHQTCKLNPNGFQWFDLSIDDQNYVVSEVKKAEKILIEYIEQIKKKYNLDNSQIILSGFSQGCMMSINLGLVCYKSFKSVIGFSGKIIDKNDLKKRIISKTDMLLFHGDADEVVPPSNLLEAKDFLERNKIKVHVNMIKNCSHHIPIEAMSLALNYIKKII
jgi:phospholipase/carboxylesterase